MSYLFSSIPDPCTDTYAAPDSERYPELYKMFLELYRNISLPKSADLVDGELIVLERIVVSEPDSKGQFSLQVLNSSPSFRMTGLEYETVLDICYAYANSLIL